MTADRREARTERDAAIYLWPPRARASIALGGAAPPLPASRAHAVDAWWRGRVRDNPRLFDGGVYCCHALERAGDDAGAARLRVWRADYKTYAWARAHGEALPGRHTVGTCVFVYDAARAAFVFVRRGRGVAFEAGRISCLGGVVSVPDDAPREAPDFWPLLDASALAELREELAAGGGATPALEYLGTWVEPVSLKLEVAYLARVRDARLGNWENDALVCVPPGALAQWIESTGDALESSTRAHVHRLAARGDLGATA